MLLLVVASAAAQGLSIPPAPSAAVTASGAPLLLPPSAAEVWHRPCHKFSNLMMSRQESPNLPRGLFQSHQTPCKCLWHWLDGLDCLGALPQYSTEALKACTGGINCPYWLPAPAEAADLHQAVTARVQVLIVQDRAAAGFLRRCCELQEGQGQGEGSWLWLCD